MTTTTRGGVTFFNLPRLAIAFDNRLHHCVFEIHVESSRGCLRHQNRHYLFLWIDPEVGTVSAAPAEAACRYCRAPLYRVTHDTHAQPKALPSGPAL